MHNNEPLLSHYPKPLKGEEIRSKFLKFYEDRDHKIIPSASLVPEDPTVLLTIAGMLPFKPVFLGQAEPPASRATSSQKCIRTNDIENVGRTARHQTYFEMLGNFSFGDYFKKEAIEWAWELLIGVFALDPKHLVVSVFRDDADAAMIWRDIVGISPSRIILMGEADNFWAAGPTGPCGPCSEIYYDFEPDLGDIDLNDDNRFIELYNLVFMQYSRDSQGVLTPLDKCCIDTGMGLERMAQVLQGVPSNYETDLIYPLLTMVADIASINYTKIDEKQKISIKIIGDHIRAVTQLLADGVTASNLGRGYVLRRLIRRMVRHGHLLGIHQLFLSELGDKAITLMQQSYPNLLNRREIILAELRSEESRFLETLERGEKLLVDLIAQNPPRITGLQAFELYDTYGFPLELTEEIAEENNLSVDCNGFDIEMKKQRERAKAASISHDLTEQSSIQKVILNQEKTLFIGYDKLETNACIQSLLVADQLVNQATEGDDVQIILDKTTLYAESGGQIGDQGVLEGKGFRVIIKDVSKKNNIFIHHGAIEKGLLKIRDEVKTSVDGLSRRKAQSHHTATHLLQAALKKVLGESVTQRGSLVAFERLRFDFNFPKPLTKNQLEDVETLVNQWIADDHPIHLQTMELDEALALGAIAMFGEKYDQVVRVVDVPDVSMELCGGTHVQRTSELGIFKIIGESGIAAGIRRIEAVAGSSVLDYVNERDLVVRPLIDHFKVKPSDIFERVLSLQNELKLLSKDLVNARREIAVAKAGSLITEAIAIESSLILVKRLDGLEGDGMQSVALTLLEKLGVSSSVVLAGIPNPQSPNTVLFVVAFAPNLVKAGLHAGKFVSPIAKLCGGGGGGRPALAQAGGRDPSKISEALDMANNDLQLTLKKLSL